MYMLRRTQCQYPIGPLICWLAEEQRISYHIGRKLHCKIMNLHRITHSTNVTSITLPQSADCHWSTVHWPTRAQPKSALNPLPLQIATLVSQQIVRRSSLTAPNCSRMEVPPIMGPSRRSPTNRVPDQRLCNDTTSAFASSVRQRQPEVNGKPCLSC